MRVPVVLDDAGSLPTYARDGDAGADLRTTRDVRLEPGERCLVPTGVRLALPPGHVGLVTPRSGLAAKRGLSIVNSPGVIDSGYRGEVLVCLVNLDAAEPVELSAGDRVAQLVVVPFVTAQFIPVDALDETVRGSGGYGSTGVGTADPAQAGRHTQ